MKSPQLSVTNIGKRIFDKHFEEVEAIDIVSVLDDGRSKNIETSLNNVNFYDQFTSLDGTADDKPDAHHHNFELNTFTDQNSKLFRNDLAISGLGDITDIINQQTIADPKKNDLDKIDRSQANVICQRPFRDRKDLSECIEVNLNMTHVGLRNEESDMSMSDESKSNSSLQNYKMKVGVADTENSLVNPDAAPKETENVAINEDSKKKKLLDGKRLTVQSAKEPIDSVDYCHILLPNSHPDKQQKKTIVLNVNDDLPNFVDDQYASMSVFKSNDMMLDKNDTSITQPLNAKIEINTEKIKRIIFENDTGDISVTQAVPNVGLLEVKDKQKTIDYESESENIFITGAVPSNLILTDQSFAHGRRKTIVSEDDDGNISITQAVPAIFFGSESRPDKRRTIVFETDTGYISVTQVVTSKSLQGKQSTIVYETDGGNISVTDVVVPEPERKTIVHTDNAGNISITQSVSSNLFLPEKTETASKIQQSSVFQNDTVDISMTQAITSNIILTESLETLSDRRKNVVYNNDEDNISITQAVPRNITLSQNLETSSEISEVSSQPSEVLSQISEDLEISSMKSKNFVFEDSIADISTTQVVPTNVIMSRLIGLLPKPSVSDEKFRKSVYEAEQISVTELLPPDYEAKSDTSNTDFSPIESENISVIQSIPKAVNLAVKLTPLSEVKEIIVENISMLNLLLPEKSEHSIVKRDAHSVECIKKEFAKVNEELIGVYEINDVIPIPQNQSISRRSLKLDSDSCNMSMTKPIPATFGTIEKYVLDKSNEDKPLELSQQVKASEDTHPIKDLVVYQADVNNPTDVLTGKTIEQGDTVSETLKESKVTPSAGNAIEKDTEKDEFETEPKVCLTSKPEIKNKENVMEFSEPLVVSAKPSVSFVSVDNQRKKDDEEQDVKLTPKDSELSNSDQRSQTAKSDPDITSQKESDLDRTSLSLSTGSLNTHQVRNAILADLLDMSKSSAISLADGIDDKNIMVDMRSANDSSTTAGKTRSSSDSLFFIKKDSEDDVLTGTDDGRNTAMRSTDIGEDHDFKRNLKQIITSQINDQIHTPNNRHFEKVVDKNLENMMKKKAMHKEQEESKNYKAAHSTEELLEMLSQFTEKEEQDNPLESDDKNPAGKKKVSYSSQMSPIRASPVHSNPIVPGRQPIVLSREDLLSNISMAQAVSQKSQMAISDSKDLQDSDVMGDSSSSPRKNVRPNPEVIKTLRFEDEESLTDSFKIDVTSPLRKTAFGETAYMKDKTHVIPSYLKDVSDGIKALMSDLVKPVTESMPFDTGKRRDTLKVPSTTSAQVQASLRSSSQIDLDIEMNSNASSTCILNPSLASSMARTLKGIMKTVNPSAFTSDGSILSDSLASDAMSVPFRIPAIQPKRTVDQTVPGILVFDHENPLNNVLLAPVNFNDAHRYHPHGSEETLKHSASLVRFKEKGEFGTPRYNIGRVLPSYPNTQLNSLEKNPFVSDTPSNIDGVKINSSNSTPVVSPSGRSVNRGIATPRKVFKDTEVNTIIAMKGANDLLAASSSLTLVDDTIALEAIQSLGSLKAQDSCFKMRYEPPISPLAPKSMGEHVACPPVDIVSKKRVHSSTKREKHQHCTLSKLDITPKPASKMRKRSLSPDGKVPAAIERKSRTRSRSSPPHSPKKSHSKSPLKSFLKSPSKSPLKSSSKSPPKSPSKSKSPSRSKSPTKTKSNTSETKTQKKCSRTKEGIHQLNTTITVQQLVTEYYLESVDDELKGQILDVINGKSESRQQVAVIRKSETSSFTSSTSHTEGKSEISESQALSVMNSKGSPMDWQPELINELSSKNLVAECESGVNVVAKINMLPFMG